MTAITTRAGKGSPLTNTEVDNNFNNLNQYKNETYRSSTAPTQKNVGDKWEDLESGITFSWTGAEWVEFGPHNILSVTTNKTIHIENPVVEDLIVFFTKEALGISSVVGVLKGGSSVDLSVVSALDVSSVSPTSHVNTQTISSLTTGTTLTINNPTIPANSWVIFKIISVTGPVEVVAVSLNF
jgi:hypothetical protein